MSKRFEGPIFIVGMSRSGTKLLRDILNNSDEVGIPSFESHFLPYLVDNFLGKFPLCDKDSKEFKKLIKNSIFYNEIRSKNANFKDIDFDRLSRKENFQSAIKYMILSLIPQKKDVSVWGDKTPNNMLHIIKLKRAFPEAKFVHIIRDPRERALSTKKAWGTSLIASAERWRHGVTEARRQGSQLGSDYMEVTYESLTKQPEAQIKNVCKFIGIKYSYSMTNLNQSAEVYKTAKNNTKSARTVVSGNVEKYKEWFTAEEVAQIESVCSTALVDFGYKTTQPTSLYTISKPKRIFLKIHDPIMTVAFHIRHWGIRRGIRYLLWRKKISSVKSR